MEKEEVLNKIKATINYNIDKYSYVKIGDNHIFAFELQIRIKTLRELYKEIHGGANWADDLLLRDVNNEKN